MTYVRDITFSSRRPDATPRESQIVVTDQGGLVMGGTSGGSGGGRTPRAKHSAQGLTRSGPHSVLTPAAVSAVVGTAARAPSVHNTQPWLFRVVGDVIELHADPDRLLSQMDPAGRELTISCGAALFGLRIGLRQQGCVPAVQIWPDPTQPWLVARVWPDGQTAGTSKIESDLIAAVPHRHTHRGPVLAGRGLAPAARGARRGRRGRRALSCSL